MKEGETLDQLVVVLASSPNETARIVTRLRENGISAQAASDGRDVARAVRENAGAAVIAEACLSTEATEQIGREIAAQPSWSDFPIVLLAHVPAGPAHLHARNASLGNVILMERSSSTSIFISAVKAILRARQLQYRMRDYLNLKLQESNNRLDFALEVSDLGMWELDLKTRNIVRSRRHDQIFGYPSMQPVWNVDVFIEHVLPELRADLLKEFEEAIKRGEWNRETQIRRVDGAIRWIWARGRVSRDENGNPVRMIGTIADVTERKQIQQALIQTEKLASVGRMAATVAHEINNPLAVVSNAVYLAATHPSASEAIRSQLAIAEKELERVAHLTRQTLGFYRETTSPEAIRLSEIINSVIELYGPKFNTKSIVVSRRYATHDCILAVVGEVRQIVSNLLTNSIDAVPRGGTIYVRTARLATLDPTHSTVRLTIADTGVGIDAAKRRKIFEPFFTTKQSVGTGLGLWVTKELTAKQRGKICVRSRPGKGTVFCLYFPEK